MAKNATEQVSVYRQACHGRYRGMPVCSAKQGADGEQRAADETLSVEAGLAAEAASRVLDLVQDAGWGGEPYA